MRQKYEFKSIVAETLLIPLYMRAKESRRNNPILYDKAAEWLADSLEYDYSQFDGAKLSEVGCVVRGWYFDCAVRRFIKAHSHPVVVNVGCGLDTRFQRIGSQKAVFYDLDLPEVIALRRELIPEQPDNVYIEASLLETDWMDDLRRKHPEYKILLTFFSPSGYEIRKNYAGADHIFYLPIDTPRNARRFLDAVHPEIAIFVKYDFWLNLLAELRRRHVRTFIVSAIFRRNSVFFRPYGGMWRQALESFDVLFVQNEESKKLLATLGFDNVLVAGDTRFDRVAEIARAARRIDLIDRFKGDARLFVAGSTWGPDEELLIRLANDNPEIKFVIAPHEMDEGRIAAFGPKQVMILDTVGLLASVYGYATWSYVGGGFGVGIHNTLEAATFGLPVAFGPNYGKFKEARDLVTLGAARSVGNYEELNAWFVPLRDNEEFLQRTSRIAKDYTTRHQGATGIIVRTIFQQ